VISNTQSEGQGHKGQIATKMTVGMVGIEQLLMPAPFL
jgi:hypothetical protein